MNLKSITFIKDYKMFKAGTTFNFSESILNVITACGGGGKSILTRLLISILDPKANLSDCAVKVEYVKTDYGFEHPIIIDNPFSGLEHSEIGAYLRILKKLARHRQIIITVRSHNSMISQNIKTNANRIALEGMNNYYKDKSSDSYNDYHENGKLKEEGYYENGERNGHFKFYYANGKLEEEGTYKDNRAVGLYKWYDLKGKLLEERNYENGISNGLCKEYYASGKIKKKYYYKDAKITGLFLVFRANGVLRSRENYKDDKKDGTFETFHPNGKIKSVNKYKNDVKIS